jgi:hypothetical protein
VIWKRQRNREMDDRIHRILDGEADSDALSPAERGELEVYLAAIAGVTESIRAIDAPDLTQRVMAEIAQVDVTAGESAVSSIRSFFRWLWVPRPIALAWRPVYAVALTLLVGFLGGALWVAQEQPTIAIVGEAAEPPPATLFVQFRLEAPGATSVEVTGSFTNWVDGVELVETLPGVWSTLLPLAPGVHDYTFIVDGETWVLDPAAPAVDDGFGGSKNRLFLTQPLENA